MNNQPNRPRQNEPPMIQMGPRRGGGPMSARLNAEKPKNTKQTVGRL